MSLDIPGFAVLFDSLADDIAGFWICHPAVQNIDSFGRSIADQLNALFFRMALQPLAAKTYLTDLKIGFS